jgi:hypothetical protein
VDVSEVYFNRTEQFMARSNDGIVFNCVEILGSYIKESVLYSVVAWRFKYCSKIKYPNQLSLNHVIFTILHKCQFLYYSLIYNSTSFPKKLLGIKILKSTFIVSSLEINDSLRLPWNNWDLPWISVSVGLSPSEYSDASVSSSTDVSGF